MKPIKSRVVTALMVCATLAGAAAATVDWTGIQDLIGNATSLLFYFIGVMLDGVGVIVPKMFSPLIQLALLGAFVTMVGIVVGIPIAIVGYVSYLLMSGGLHRGRKLR